MKVKPDLQELTPVHHFHQLAEVEAAFHLALVATDFLVLVGQEALHHLFQCQLDLEENGSPILNQGTTSSLGNADCLKDLHLAGSEVPGAEMIAKTEE